MSLVTFVGLGLNDEKSISLEGLEHSREAKSVFVELYTNPMSNLDIGRLEVLIGKKIILVSRAELEDQSGDVIVRACEKGKVAFLVPGDPMVATTHVSLRLILAKKKIMTRIVHGQSIFSAIAGATGLQSYKFGKSITLPSEQSMPRSILSTILDNGSRGLHTLLLLEPDIGGRTGITISKAIDRIITAWPELSDRVVVGAARIGALDEDVKAGKMRTLERHDFGLPPHSLVVVGRLHFMEAQALEVFCGANKAELENSI